MARRHLWILAAIVVYAAGFRLIGLNRPFAYDAEGSGSLNAVLARSYLRFGWAQSRGMPILSLDADRAPSIVFYPDHPPLVPLLVVPFYRAFGVGEWQTRLPIALTTIGAILLLARIVARTASPRAGVTAAAIFAAVPMTLYFGGFADVVGMPLMFFVLLAIDRYLPFQRQPGVRTFLPFALAFAAACVCDWPAYVLAPVLIVHLVWTRPRRDWVWAAAVGLMACALFAVVYAYITLATHMPWTWMADLFARRSALVGGRTYTWRQWIVQAARVNGEYHTLPLVAAAAIWMAASARSRAAATGATSARLLLGWAVIYAVIGSKALFDHEWAWMAFTPGLTIAAALLLERRSGAAVACGVAAFALWTTYGVFTRLYPAQPGWPFSPRQMADAIRTAAPQPRDVALVVGAETDAQLWFYADRPLRSGIWSIADFERRLGDDRVDLMFNFDEQPWKARATGVVFPRIWSRQFAGLHDYLDRHYRRCPLSADLAAVFDIYDLKNGR